MSKKKQRAKEILRQAKPEEIKAAIDDYFSRKPLLTPRLKNWEEDLPRNGEKQVVPGRLMQVTEINDTWMEIPRYENIMWGGAWLGVIAMIIPTVLFIWGEVDFYPSGLDFETLLTFFLFLFFSSSMILLNLRMALFVPRDQPIRFNRKRQKIYIFEHHRKAWNLISTTTEAPEKRCAGRKRWISSPEPRRNKIVRTQSNSAIKSDNPEYRQQDTQG